MAHEAGLALQRLFLAVGSYRKIRKIYAEKPTITEPEVPKMLPGVQGKVEFKNVSFHKEDGHEILHEISFHVKPGGTIGIMGATGAGKTSIIQLLQRSLRCHGRFYLCGRCEHKGYVLKAASKQYLHCHAGCFSFF